MTSTGSELEGQSARGDILRVFVAGDLDTSTTEQFFEEALVRLGDQPLRRVEIDMSRAGFIDSTGLSALVDLRRAAHALGADTKLVNADRRTERLLRIVGLDTTFL